MEHLYIAGRDVSDEANVENNFAVALKAKHGINI